MKRGGKFHNGVWLGGICQRHRRHSQTLKPVIFKSKKKPSTIPVQIRIRCVRLTLNAFSWQESAITHVLSCKLAINSQALFFFFFWGCSTWLWGYWRGTSKSWWVKECIFHNAYSKSCIFSSSFFPSQSSVKFEKNVARKCCLCFQTVKLWSQFLSFGNFGWSHSFSVNVILWSAAHGRCHDVVQRFQTLRRSVD